MFDGNGEDFFSSKFAVYLITSSDQRPMHSLIGHIIVLLGKTLLAVRPRRRGRGGEMEKNTGHGREHTPGIGRGAQTVAGGIILAH